eukprot:Lithocolla_globosa_v1_NODE_2877_length_1838_cov_6.860909.p3 type:complete len:123 gc:universal NODE_2877_length_1838_cov_6.860909:712-344(-)
MAVPTFNSVPHALHFNQIPNFFSAFTFCKELDCLLSCLDQIVSQHIFGALCVDETILQVKSASIVHHSTRHAHITTALVDLCFELKELHHCGGMIDSGIDFPQRLDGIPHFVVVLCGKEQCP